MALITAGYWPNTYWPSRYWQADYWPEYTVAAAAVEEEDLQGPPNIWNIAEQKLRREDEDLAVLMMEVARSEL